MSGVSLGRRRTRAAFQPVVLPAVDKDEVDTRTERALTQLADAVNTLGGTASYEADVDLAVGTTTISHGLDREPTMVQVAPKVAAAAFAWGWDPVQPGNPRPKQLIQITSATAATVRIRVE